MKDPVIATGIAPVAALAAALFWCGGTAHAQGLELTFGIGLRAETDSNPTLAAVSPGSVNQTGLDLSFGLTSETARSKLSLGASVLALSASGPGSPVSGLANPALTLSYERASANAEFTLDAALNDNDLATNTDVTDFTDATSGVRRTAQLSTAISWGTEAPLGFGLTAGASDVSYHDTPAGSTLTNYRTQYLGASAHAALSPVLRADFGVTGSRFTQAGIDEDTLRVQAGLTLDRPTGNLTLHLTSDDTPDGRRNNLTFGHSITLTTGTLSYSLGATQGVDGKTYATGALAYAQDLPGGSLSLALDRTVAANSDTNNETVQSSASFGYSHAITPRATLAVALNWAEERDTASTVANTSLSATWTQDIAADWALDLGYTHRLRDDGGITGQSDSVFLELRRSFSIRP